VTRLVSSLLLLALAAVLPSALTAQTPTAAPAASATTPIIPAPPQIAGSAWIVIDANSQRVIAEHNADTPVAPASLTKMMTGYVLSELVASGKVSWEDKAFISHNAWAQNPKFVGSSLMWMDVNSEVSLRDLYYGVVISSGNDASVAIAEHLAGSEDSFAEMMNEQAARLGMSGTHFVNAHGLPDPQLYTTARDLATLARAVVLDHPEDYKVYAERYFTFNNIRQMNRNELLGEPGVDGIKTGHTEDAGYCLVSSAERDGMRLITVVMGTASKRARTEESRKLLGYGFRFFETPRLLNAGQSLMDPPLKVWGGAADSVRVGVARDVFVTIPRGRASELKAEAIVTVSGLKAPVEPGQVLGTVAVKLGDEVLLEEPLTALDAVERGGFFRRVWDSLVLFFLGLFGQA
jgi:serine-type D-Ala-D-Ala carboxypeptidase (penicillin-binding protein 5/6)